jgi:hypothetical protein
MERETLLAEIHVGVSTGRTWLAPKAAVPRHGAGIDPERLNGVF